MKWTTIRVNDSIHYFIERLTNATAPEREHVSTLHRAINCPLTDKTAEVLSAYTSKPGKAPKTYAGTTYNKSELCAILVTAYWKAWSKADAGWHANEAKELKSICVEHVNEIRRAAGKRTGAQKVTKQMMLSAILHRLAMTQDLKIFFDKTL
jgi:hypothetical protein